MDDRVVSYAQNREDVILAAFFDENEKGFYVDVGANHPVNDSVTKYFYERGWNGINIEPIEEQHRLLVKDRPRDINLKLGVSDKPGELKLRVYDKGDGLSTFSDAMKGDYEAHVSYFTDRFHEDLVEVKTLEQIFKENDIKKISFLKVDVEGYELEVLRGNDWSKYRPDILCIEANHIINDWHPLLDKNGYELVFNDGLNEYFVSKEAKKRKAHFSYVKGLIGRPIISSRWNQQLSQSLASLKRAEIELQAEKNKVWETQREVAHLQAELLEQRRIRNLIKTLFRKIDASILGNIESLNKPKRKHASKLVPIKKGTIDAAVSRRELLEIAKKNDHDSFYSNSNTGGYRKLHAYKISIFIYRKVRGFLKLIFKVLRKILRKIRRRSVA